jgi:hypothetical protein
VPLLIEIIRKVNISSSSTTFPNDGNRSRFSVDAIVAGSLPGKCNKSEYESGESDEEADDEGSGSAIVGGVPRCF